MADATYDYIVKFKADVDDASKKIDRAGKGFAGFGKSVAAAGVAVAGSQIGQAVIQFGQDAVTAASDAEQAWGGAQTVFGDFAGEIDRFSQTTAENMGISRSEFLQTATLMGTQLKNAGVPLAEVTTSTETLTQRAADLAAMFGGDVSTAVAAMGSAFKGEYDPIEQFGISLNANAINAKAVEMGLASSTTTVDSYGKAMATQALILEQSAEASGTFAKESDTLAGRQAVLTAQFQDLQAEIGTKLLPIINSLLDFIINKAVPWFEKWGDEIIDIIRFAFTPLIAQIETARGVIDVVSKLLKGDFSGAWDAAKQAFDRFTKPVRDFFDAIGRILDDAMGDVDEKIMAPFKTAFNWLKTNIFDRIEDWAYKLPGVVQKFFGNLADVIKWPFTTAFDAIKSLWNSTVGGFGFEVPSWVPGVGGKGFKIPRMAAGGIVTRPTVALIGEAGPEAVVPLGKAGTMGVTINVYALTSNAEVGRKVFEALREYERTTGRRVA